MSVTKQTYIVVCTVHGKVTTKSLTEPTVCPIDPADPIKNVFVTEKNNPLSALSGVVVDPDEKNGNYTSIAEAFSDGNTDVFVRNGTYVETSDIVLPDRGKLRGQTSGGVVIVLVGGARIVVDGSGGVKETAGTISYTNGSDAVTGVGTTFTNLSVGNFILIGNTYYQIDGITDDTNLSLLVPFQGRSLSAQPYCAQAMVTGVIIQNIVATQSTGNNIFFRAARFSHISEFALTKSSTNLRILDCADCSFTKFSSTNSSAGAGVSVENSVDLSFQSVNVINNLGSGFEILNGCSNINFTSCYSSCNSIHGFLIDNSTLINITEATVKQNTQNGIEVVNGSQHIVVAATNITENGVGINSTTSTNSFGGNVLYNNVSGITVSGSSTVTSNTVSTHAGDGITVNGDNNVVSNNVVRDNDNGIYVDGSDSVINGNRCSGNSNNGIQILVTSLTNVVYANHLVGNSGSNFLDSSPSTFIYSALNNNIIA